MDEVLERVLEAVETALNECHERNYNNSHLNELDRCLFLLLVSYFQVGNILIESGLSRQLSDPILNDLQDLHVYLSQLCIKYETYILLKLSNTEILQPRRPSILLWYVCNV